MAGTQQEIQIYRRASDGTLIGCRQVRRTVRPVPNQIRHFGLDDIDL